MLRIEWDAAAGAALAPRIPFSDMRWDSPEAVDVVDYSIKKEGDDYSLVHSKPRSRLRFRGWEPRALALLSPRSLVSSGLFGALLDREGLAAEPRLGGVRFLSEALFSFGQAELHDEGYYASAYPGRPGKPGEAGVVDLTEAYEAWLYDRCATYLLGYAHLGDERFYRHGLRACSFYASKIDERGYFTLKTDAQGRATDAKYSHVRGLYFYYALTGDEAALEAGRRVARMWLDEPNYVGPYRKGRLRGPKRHWTERHLAHALSALVYGYLLTRDVELLAGARDLFEATYGHVSTANSARLRGITGHALVSQDCLVHSVGQHDHSSSAEPICSPWMSALLVDPLLRYQAITGDPRVDEVFIRLGRYVRDTATTYSGKKPFGDTFLRPVRCLARAKKTQRDRMLLPAYSAARRADGSRTLTASSSDMNHCVDVTTLTAAALRGLRATGQFDRPGPAPFKSEGDSLIALHHELAHCAAETFRRYSRPKRDPQQRTSRELARGVDDSGWILRGRIGFPSHPSRPVRKLSWWFNGSLLQFQLLREAGVSFETLQPGAVQPVGCR